MNHQTFLIAPGPLNMKKLIDDFEASWDVSLLVYSCHHHFVNGFKYSLTHKSLFAKHSLSSSLSSLFLSLCAHATQFICNKENTFTLKTDFEASRYRLVNIDITQPTKVTHTVALLHVYVYTCTYVHVHVWPKTIWLLWNFCLFWPVLKPHSVANNILCLDQNFIIEIIK